MKELTIEDISRIEKVEMAHYGNVVYFITEDNRYIVPTSFDWEVKFYEYTEEEVQQWILPI